MENLKSEMINKLFNINVDSGITYELINFDNNVIFESTDAHFIQPNLNLIYLKTDNHQEN
ncbi:hypothetical protein ONA23_05655 [Mycoplasmopsis cynos]|uniref:hypothetical protein n=1 Tax=Mycoplasmopsis cynos TaxID=171284 RepID=UPI0024CBD23E|nr:hypothetical protein [Mycoplasmopsis cynos]WAM06432.1 hypothetical protein ONA23_05655 [Mycoplasmopsis cynos]